MTGEPVGAEWRLVRLAQRGDVAAFEQLYRATIGRIYALCLRMTGSRHLAEELTQESYLRAWQRLPSFRGDAAFSTWLHRVAANVVLGHLRSRSWSDQLSNERVVQATEPETAAGGDVGTAVDLERAIARLPEGARTVFVLHDVEGYRHEEIAALAGIAVGTSKAQLNRARRLLRGVLTS